LFFCQEKVFLKHLQTWFNQDTYADNNDEGKVIVDNTEPVVKEWNLFPKATANHSQIAKDVWVRISPSRLNCNSSIPADFEAFNNSELLRSSLLIMGEDELNSKLKNLWQKY